MSTLAEELPKQQQRVRELREIYKSIGPAGTFALMMIDGALLRAERAAASGDLVEMIRACKELQEFKE
jgi:hypothetical protein